MRRLAVLLGMSGIVALIAIIPGAASAANLRLAQTSTVTNCMMACNSTAALCQTTCLVPGSAPTGAATTTSNANLNTSCQLGCSTQQISCQTTCAQNSPSP
ncbi:MAG TPA: hypothetical protein VHY10_03940 [Xanthobacteraceae bacterium]|nr:hypothetical protein [Xanthobacteraceae bacterium]